MSEAFAPVTTLSPPKNAMAGISTRYDSTPPANIYLAIFIPHIYPTPANAGNTSAPIPQV